ncbi:MAG: hypothetical protein II789_07415, partial [Clostridia bacterium]|nr:hypothetical protein [Clostridia bacterium]
EGAVFSKMSDFSPFLRNRQCIGCSCDRSCMPHCPDSLVQPRSRSFNRILAHFYPAIFDFLNKKCDIRFFVPFHAHFSARSVMH